MVGETGPEASISSTFRAWWSEQLAGRGLMGALRTSAAEFWTFLLDSTPQRRRQRYGDAEYDWDFRVDTTSATVGWRDRLMGVFHSAYQPTEPAAFHEMMQALEIDFGQFTFIDLGSGKGRTLLMASEYPFRRIVGVELLPDLHRVALGNLQKFRSAQQQCSSIESRCEDARTFQFPADPIVLYLFNPLPESGLVAVMRSLQRSLAEHPRQVYIVYYNPLLRHVFDANPPFREVLSVRQYAVYKAG